MSEKYFKIGEYPDIWQSYEQKRDCLVHFLRRLVVCWPGAQSVWENYALVCNFAKYSPI